jgi:hypothetical protein
MPAWMLKWRRKQQAWRSKQYAQAMALRKCGDHPMESQLGKFAVCDRFAEGDALPGSQKSVAESPLGELAACLIHGVAKRDCEFPSVAVDDHGVTSGTVTVIVNGSWAVDSPVSIIDPTTHCGEVRLSDDDCDLLNTAGSRSAAESLTFSSDCQSTHFAPRCRRDSLVGRRGMASLTHRRARHPSAPLIKRPTTPYCAM